MSESHTLVDELNRKALDTLERIVVDYQTGIISVEQARSSLQTLFQAVSGLITDDLFDMISEASKEFADKTGEATARRLFISDGCLYCLEYTFGEPVVKLHKLNWSETTRMTWSSTKVLDFSEELNPYEVARGRFDGYIESFARLGYKELN
ncbi:hypothetical protein [Dyella telluris]|uniref:Uncharacterized protein n=1 Tax=Dyella telluris TaxID=2763498 RepID=A0A7G8Q4M4_9GAMM|nr:hypothetical protein [Dyella telluris]QNK01732.1 hypothetical protein H8F01_00685 [Dyella telluris]